MAAHFKSWADYLRVLSDPDQDSLLTILKERGRRPTPYPRDNEEQKASKRIPWVTFVLGSGCLTATDVSSNDVPFGVGAVADARKQMSADLDDMLHLYPNLQLDNLAARFLELLTCDRTGVSDAREALATVVVRDDVRPREQSARVALAAALATQLYAAALETRPLLQSADRETVLLDLGSPGGVGANADIIEPLKHVLGLLSDADDAATPTAQRALAELAKAVSASVSVGRVRRFHVELLTAFAWYFFTAGTRVYPGWTELMLLRTFEDSTWFRDEVVTANSAESRLRPPIKRLHRQDDWVVKRIVDVTNSSWRSRRSKSDTRTDRDEFYDLVASFLNQQATAVFPKGRKGASKPAAVCFSTSFDLELEMALWDAGQPFVVILPVFALDKDYKHSASLHWVWTEVTPTDLDPAVGPCPDPDHTPSVESTLNLPPALWRPGGWRLADQLKDQLGHHGRGLDIPIVVRLAGSPLMRLPSPEDLGPTPNTSELHHALLLDEYTAFQQAYQDFDDLSASGGVLPTFLSADASPTRTWVLLGTQLGDPAVRLRMAAHHVKRRVTRNAKRGVPESAKSGPSDVEGKGGSGISVSTEPEETAPDSNTERPTSGIVINAMSQLSDRELFLWEDFDVVDGRHTDLVPQLHELLGDIHQELIALRPAPNDEAGQGGSGS